MTYSQPVEELLEQLYVHEVEGGPYPADDATAEAVDQATAAGLVAVDGERCGLTATGRQAGQDVLRRHRLAERLLRDVLRVAPEEYDTEACRFEHVLAPDVTDRICALLGHPRTCPHDKPIPEGACCRASRADGIREVSPLCDGRPGDRGTVAYLATRDEREVQKMMAMGILPGSDIELIRRYPSYVFQVGYSQFTVDRPLAAIIYVHWQPSARPSAAAAPAGEGGGRRRRFRWGRRGR